MGARFYLAALALVATGATAATAATAAAPRPVALTRPAVMLARPGTANLQAIASAGKRLVAAGEHGLIMVSDDAGQHWRQVQVPVGVTLTALRFANAKDGWATGNMGVVLRTNDGGTTWRRVFDGYQAGALAEQSARQVWDAVKPDPNDAEHPLNLLLADAHRLVEEGADKPLLDIALRADGAVLVVGAYGLAFLTRDGGATWQAQMAQLPNPEGVTWYGVVDRGGETTLFGEQGVLLRANGGAFAATPSPTTGSLFGGLSLRSGALLLFGLRGKVFRSDRPGAPWTEIATPVDASLISGVQLPDETVLLLGAAGQIVASADQGVSFHALPLATRFPFTGAAVASDGALVIVGARGLLRLPAAQLQRALTVSSR